VTAAVRDTGCCCCCGRDAKVGESGVVLFATRGDTIDTLDPDANGAGDATLTFVGVWLLFINADTLMKAVLFVGVELDVDDEDSTDFGSRPRRPSPPISSFSRSDYLPLIFTLTPLRDLLP